MHYNFNTLNNRRNTNSYKWDSSKEEDIIPLWVADMDFKTAPAIIDALRKRVEHGIFGYTHVPESYYQSVISWFKRRHGWTIYRDSFIYTSGVVPAISAIIKALTKEGEKVIIQTPVYNCFFSSIKNNGCIPSENKLLYNNGIYAIDFDDLEKRASEQDAKIMLLCNPHNPSGRVWTKKELLRIGEICRRNGVIVVSDEIHCELVYPPFHYTPYSNVSTLLETDCVVCISPSKAFNIAGLQIANIICNNPDIRKLIDKAININEVCDVNPFGVIATIAAYNEGEDWLNSLVQYLWNNYLFLKEFFEENLPEFKITPLEGTYLVWVNFKSLGLSSKFLENKFLTEGKVWLNEGIIYGEAGEGFMRINIACPRARLEEGLKRIVNVLKIL